MCIIVVKPENVSLPSKEILETCFKNNSDGAGFMYSYKGNVFITKGFMSIEELLIEIDKLAKEIVIDKISMVFHFRIGTQGKNNMENTHPFPISEDIEKITARKIKCNVGVVHNGIISLTRSYYEAEHSDTVLFVRDYLSCLIDNNKFYKNPKMVRIIDKLANSKLAFLSSDGHVTTIGDFNTKDGILYSNYTYTASKYDYRGWEDERFDCNYSKSTSTNSNYSFITHGYDYLSLVDSKEEIYMLDKDNTFIDILPEDIYIGTDGFVYGRVKQEFAYIFYLIEGAKIYDYNAKIVKSVYVNGVSKYMNIKTINKLSYSEFLIKRREGVEV